MNIVSGTAAIAVIPCVKVPALGAFAVIAVSVALHAAYKIALASVYGSADLGRAYPLVRGITPIIATVLGLVFLGDRPSGLRLLGTVLISAGIIALVFEQDGSQKRNIIFPAVLAGTTVACYSVLDAYGVRLTPDWLSFSAWLVFCDSACFVAYCLAMRRGIAIMT